MIYYNSDGSQSLCGNGGRCAVAFAKYLNIIDSKATFEAIDGLHYATIDEDYVRLQMHNVSSIRKVANDLFLDTGSPHHIKMTDALQNLDVKTEGAKIRYSERYGESGTNVNFVSKESNDTFSIRTYERGVEDETLSCGTGVTAVALAMHYIGETEKNIVNLKAVGGDLQVTFDKVDESYQNIWLCGSAKQVFKGLVEI